MAARPTPGLSTALVQRPFTLVARRSTTNSSFDAASRRKSDCRLNESRERPISVVGSDELRGNCRVCALESTVVHSRSFDHCASAVARYMLVCMFICLSTSDLHDVGWTTHQITTAVNCCLRRVRTGIYVVAKRCSHPSHVFVATLAASKHVHLPGEESGMRKQDEDLRILVRSYAGRMPPQTVLSHRSALIVHGLPVPYFEQGSQPVAEAIHPRNGVRHTPMLVRRRELAVCDIVEADGTPVTSLLRTLADVARDYPPAFSVAVLDAAVHQGKASEQMIADYCEAHRPRTLRRRVDATLNLMDGSRESVAESICAVRFDEYSLRGFEPQVEFYDEQNRFIGRTDFADKKAKVIAEFDGEGKYHLTGKDPRAEMEKERRREYKLRNLGYAVFRILWQDLFTADVFLRIRESVNSRLAVSR